MDAAHGKSVRAIVAWERTHAIGLSPDAGRLSKTAGKRRGGPTTTIHADTRQTSRVPCAVARSRRKRAITNGNAAERETIQNAKCTIHNFVIKHGRDRSVRHAHCNVMLSVANRRTQRAHSPRKTNAVQSNIYIVSIQILRRYAPQNDKLLLNCAFCILNSELFPAPQQTGVVN